LSSGAQTMSVSGRDCILYTDGGSRGNPGPAGSGFVLRDPAGSTLCASGHFIDRATNNQAEYDALLRGLRAALEHGCRNLEVRMDSELIVRQMTGEYRVKNAGLKGLFGQAKQLVRQLDTVRFVHVRREDNVDADRLANEAMDARADVGDVLGECAALHDQGTLF